MGQVAYYYSNRAVPNTLGNSGGISNSATSIIAQATPSGFPGQFPFKLRLDPGTPSEEVVKVVSGAGTSANPWIVGSTAGGGASSTGRGWDGTAAVSHQEGTCVIQHAMSAEDLTLARSHEASDNTSTIRPHNLPLAAWQQSSFAVIQETALSNSSTNTFTFSNIPQIYAHLMVVVNGRLTDVNSFSAILQTTVNGDSSANYSHLRVNDTNTGSGLGGFADGQQFSETSMSLLELPGSKVGVARNAGGGIAWFPNYSSTVFHKMAISISGWGNINSNPISGTLRWSFYGGASGIGGITSLTFGPSGGLNYQSGTFFGLYAFGT